jgi:hypothetical protein
MKLVTTTETHLAPGTTLAMEAKEYLYMTSYGDVCFRSASGCSVNVKVDPRLLSEAIQSYAAGLRHLSDPERVAQARLTLDGLEAAIAGCREELANK